MSKTERCDLGVGCDEYGVCYAEAHGVPGQCGKARPTLSDAEIVEMLAPLAKIMPIRVQDGADYAEVFFSDGVAHSTRAMTMNPKDWLDVAACLTALRNAGLIGDGR